MKQMRVSAVVALAVTILAVVTVVVFSFATMSYQREVVEMKRINIEYRRTIADYRAVLNSIQTQLAQARVSPRI
ncbi:MAG: hypothetical protein ABIC68_02355 [Candidatus Omnitrophota bacterium]